MAVSAASLAVGVYLTDGRRLLQVLGLSDTEAHCENAWDPGRVVTLTLAEVTAAWRIVEASDGD